MDFGLSGGGVRMPRGMCQGVNDAGECLGDIDCPILRAMFSIFIIIVIVIVIVLRRTFLIILLH